MGCCFSSQSSESSRYENDGPVTPPTRAANVNGAIDQYDGYGDTPARVISSAPGHIETPVPVLGVAESAPAVVDVIHPHEINTPSSPSSHGVEEPAPTGHIILPPTVYVPPRAPDPPTASEIYEIESPAPTANHVKGNIADPGSNSSSCTSSSSSSDSS